MEGIRTLEYRPEDREAGLREEAERGRKAQIALEVMNDILNERKMQIVSMLETILFDSDLSMYEHLAELRVIRSLRCKLEDYITIGEWAEEELTKNGE